VRERQKPNALLFKQEEAPTYTAESRAEIQVFTGVKLEEAKSGRAKCKVCQDLISAGEMRVGVETFSGGRFVVAWLTFSGGRFVVAWLNTRCLQVCSSVGEHEMLHEELQSGRR
jgi:hypothetical protein